jgi:tetratricopeptide (TPR) repeat protein
LIRAPRDELFDLSQDPAESRSIAAERPQVRMAMRRALDAIIANSPLSAPAAVSGADREKLAALGYIGTQSGRPFDAPGDTLADPKDKIGLLRKYRQATKLASERRDAEAIALYGDVLRDDPEMADVWLQLAALYDRRGMTGDALAAYRHVISRKPKDPAALTGAAAVLIQLRKFDEARAHAELAVDVSPAIAHELLARLAVQRGDAAAARNHAALARQADPSLPMPAFVEGLLAYNTGSFAAAASNFGEASQALSARTERIADVNYLLGDSLARLERYPEAERAFKAELAIFPAHLRARAGLAMLYAATNRPREAEAAIEEITRIAPTREGFSMAAQLWTMFGQPQKAAAARGKMGRR